MMKKRAFVLLFVVLGVSVTVPADANPVVVMETNAGYIVVELRPDEAPITVDNFLDYVNDGFYNGLLFHRVMEGFMIQGGFYYIEGFSLRSPTVDPPIPLENPNGLSNIRGSLAMARTDVPDSATSSFYINQADNIQGSAVNLDYQDPLNPGYCVFGHVISSMRVVDAIAHVPVINLGGPLHALPVDPLITIHKAAVPLFVATSGNDTTGDGTQVKPFRTIQKGIDSADPNGCVVVLPGTYYENIDFGGKEITVMSTDPADTNMVEATIIDGQQNGPVVTFSGIESANSVISGLTITNGNASRGGGIYGGSAHATAGIRYNIIKNNWAQNGGAIAYCDGLIQNNTVIENEAFATGGGLYNCDGKIQNNIIAHNTAGSRGGGLFQCSGIIENNTVYANSAGRGGGLCNCGGAAKIQNCIVWNNTASIEGSQFFDDDPPYAAPSYSCIEDWTGGLANISVEPLFADAANGDFHLKSQNRRWDRTSGWVSDSVTSQCIDTANHETAISFEYHGGDVENNRANLGAYGNDPEASIGPDGWSFHSDFTNDGLVNFQDYVHLANMWLDVSYTYDYFYTDLDRDGTVEMKDTQMFAEEWLGVAPWSWVNADLNTDGKVNLCDFARMASNWSKTGTGLEGDFNGDEAVNVTDLAFFAGVWLK